MSGSAELILDQTLDGVALAEVGDVASRAERSGAGAVWVGEIRNDPFLPMLPAALSTSTLQVGTSVAIAFARSPMTVALSAYELQAASRGRFILGLGTQVRGHITRRFGMPWSAPAARMADYVGALHAIWRAWAHDEPLEYNGEFYQFTLMPPMFRPPHNAFGDPKIMIAGVGRRLVRVATQFGDGLFVHPFTSPEYYKQQIEPAVIEGLTSSGRARSQVTVAAALLTATGMNRSAVEQATEAARRQIAFYASTPAYAPVLATHGWEALQGELAHLVRKGQWDMLGQVISDDVLRTFALVGSPQEVGEQLVARWTGLVDRASFVTTKKVDDVTWSQIYAAAGPQPGAGPSPADGGVLLADAEQHVSK